MEVIRSFSEVTMMNGKSGIHSDLVGFSGTADVVQEADGEVSFGSHSSKFCIKGWKIDPSTDRMELDGKTIKLEPKVMSLLVYLAEKQGELVTRADIEETVWSDVTVGYDTVTGAIQKLRKAFGDNARKPEVIETVSKKGYRLLEPVRPYQQDVMARPAMDSGASELAPRLKTSALLIQSKVAMIVVATMAVLGGAVWWSTPTVRTDADNLQPKSAEPVLRQSLVKPVIGVLPFDNLSGDIQQEYFSDGITDDIITDLSRISGLLVIARNTMFTFKGNPTNVRNLAREVGVTHVLEGSVRKVGNRVRVNAQLIDATTGHHLWANRYDREIRDVFALQDELTQQIVAALSIKLRSSEREQLSRSAQAHPEAYDLLLRGLERYRRFTPDMLDEAQVYFERAIALDPNFARAHVDLGLAKFLKTRIGADSHPEKTVQEALRITEHALSLDDTLPVAYFLQSAIYRTIRRYDEALTAAQRSVALDPNYADGYSQVAASLNYAGKPNEGLEAIKQSMKLDPRHPFFYVWIEGESYYLLGQYEKAAAAFERVRTKNPQFPLAHKMLAATYVELGRLDEAEWAAAELKTIIPGYSLERERISTPYKDLDAFNRLIEALRKAGL